MVDIEFVEKFPRVVPLEELKNTPELGEMLVIKRGQRLSVQPVEPAHFKVVRTRGRQPAG
jgi:predicted RNA-binding protein with PUA-like domain